MNLAFKMSKESELDILEGYETAAKTILEAFDKADKDFEKWFEREVTEVYHEYGKHCAEYDIDSNDWLRDWECVWADEDEVSLYANA